MDVDSGSMVGEDTEAAVAAVQDHCFVFVFHDIHPYWKEDDHLAGGDPLEKVFAPLRTIFGTPRRIERLWFAFSRKAAGRLGRSSSEIFLAVEKLQIYLRMPHLFDRRMHGRNCLGEDSYPAGPHNLPCPAI